MSKSSGRSFRPGCSGRDYSAQGVARRAARATRPTPNDLGHRIVLNYLLVPFVDLPNFGFLRLFQYITFRAAGAAVTALLLTFIVGPVIMRAAAPDAAPPGGARRNADAHAEGQNADDGRADHPRRDSHQHAAVGALDNRYVLLAMVAMRWMGAIGFLDDYLKLKQKRPGEKNTGLVERYKLVGQVTLGLALGYYLWQHPLSSLPGASTTLPFFKYILIVPLTAGLGWLYVLFVTFILTGTSNAVNITDGLDGLAAGLTAIAVADVRVLRLRHRPRRREPVPRRLLPARRRRAHGLLPGDGGRVYRISLVQHASRPRSSWATPARSRSAARSASVAILLKSEFLLLLVGAVFVAEMMSVIVQRFVFKYRKTTIRAASTRSEHRVFRRAPLHHHFEVKGWNEAQVVVRFWIIGILCAFIALSTLKLR